MRTNEQKESKSLYFEHRTKEGQKRYFVYRDRLIKSGIVSPLSVQIWEKIVDTIRRRTRFSNKNIHFLSIPELANHFKKSLPTIRKAIKELQDQGLVTREQGKGGGSGEGKKPNISEYQLLNHPCFSGEFTKKDTSQRSKVLSTHNKGKGSRSFPSVYKNLLMSVKEAFSQGSRNLEGQIEGNIFEVSKTLDGFQLVKNPECCFSIALVKISKEEEQGISSSSESPENHEGGVPPSNNPPVEEDTDEGIESNPQPQESAPVEKPKPKRKSKVCPEDPLKDRPFNIPSNCPRCQKPIVQRNGKYGKFWTCSGYPDCYWKPRKLPRHIQAINDEPWTQEWLKNQLPDDDDVCFGKQYCDEDTYCQGCPKREECSRLSKEVSNG